MKYQEFRGGVQSGDVFLVEGNGIIGTAIRVLTGQQYSHVAMLVWLEEGLFVAEMKEGKGYRNTPASQWIEITKGQVYYGVAPKPVAERKNYVVSETLKARINKKNYSYWSLIIVWVSQILRKKLPSGLVCSTWIQKVWQGCGVEFEKTADPGDIAPKCQVIIPLLKEK